MDYTAQPDAITEWEHDLIKFSERIRLRGEEPQKASISLRVFRWNSKPHAPEIWHRIWGTQDFPEPGHDKTFKLEKECSEGRYLSEWVVSGWADGQYGEGTRFYPHAKDDVHKAPDRANRGTSHVRSVLG